MSDELPAVYVNYERLEREIDNLRRRVTELEHSNFDLQRKYYGLLTYVKGKEIEGYLANYKPKGKKKQQEETTITNLKSQSNDTETI